MRDYLFDEDTAELATRGIYELDTRKGRDDGTLVATPKDKKRLKGAFSFSAEKFDRSEIELLTLTDVNKIKAK